MRARYFKMDRAGAELIVLPVGDNFAYLMARHAHAVVIDPPEADPVIDVCEEWHWTVEWVLNTHHHGDHTGGNAGLKKRFGCRLAGPDDPRLGAMFAQLFLVLFDDRRWRRFPFEPRFGR